MPAATVTLLRDGQRAADTSSNAREEFAFQSLSTDRYQVEVSAPGFEPAMSDLVFVGASAGVAIEIASQIGPLEQDVVVGAAATDLPQSQVGSPVTVTDRETLEELAKPDVLEALRTVSGIQVLPTGQRGGPAAIFGAAERLTSTKC